MMPSWRNVELKFNLYEFAQLTIYGIFRQIIKLHEIPEKYINALDEAVDVV